MRVPVICGGKFRGFGVRLRPWAALILGPVLGWYVEAPQPRRPLRLVRLEREAPSVRYVLRASGEIRPGVR